MRKLVADFIYESSSTIGNAESIQLVSVNGYGRFSDAFSVGDVVYYSIEDGDNKESGIGTIGAGNTLQRTTPLVTLVGGVYTDESPNRIELSGAAFVGIAPTNKLIEDLDSPKAELSKAFGTGERVTIDLEKEYHTAPLVNVTKDLEPQLNQVNESLKANSAGTNFSQESESKTNEFVFQPVAGYEREDGSYQPAIIGSIETVFQGEVLSTLKVPAPLSITTNGDGTSAFVTSFETADIFVIEFQTPYDLDTVSPTVETVNLPMMIGTQITSLVFSSDGMYLFLGIGGLESGQTVHVLELQTPYELEGLPLGSDTGSLDISAFGGFGCAVNSDGTKVFASGSNASNNPVVREFTLSTPYDLNTATETYELETFSTMSVLGGMDFSEDGTTILTPVIDFSDGTNYLKKWDLSTPWDLSTAVEDVSSEVTVGNRDFPIINPRFVDNGNLVFSLPSLGDGVGEIYSWVLTTPYNLSSKTTPEPEKIYLTGMELYPDFMKVYESGTKMFFGLAETGEIYYFEPSEAYKISFGQLNETPFSFGGSINDFFFSEDGLNIYFYVIEETVVLHQYALGTSFDLSSISATSVATFDFGTEPQPDSFIFTKSGNTMIIFSSDGSGYTQLREYDLSTPYDISTMTFSGNTYGQPSQLGGIPGFFTSPEKNTNETEIIAVNPATKELIQVSLGISGVLSGENEYKTVYGFPTKTCTGFYISDDGSYVYYFLENEDIEKGQLTTPYDIDTLVSGYSFSDDDIGKTIYIRDAYGELQKGNILTKQNLFFEQVDILTNRITEWYLDSVETDGTLRISSNIDTVDEFNIKKHAVLKRIYNAPELNMSKSISINSSSDSLFILDQYDTIQEFPLDGENVLNILSSEGGSSFNVTSQDNQAVSIFFKPDGTALFVLGLQNDSVYSYTLSTPWDLSTASYDSVSFSVSIQTISATGMTFSLDGTTMCLVDMERVYSYTLSTPWDLSTASYDSVLNIETVYQYEPYSPSNDLSFSKDGSYLIVSTDNGGVVGVFSLGATYDISTATYTPNMNTKLNSLDCFVLSTEEDYLYYAYNNNLFQIKVSFEDGFVNRRGVTVSNNDAQINTYNWIDFNSLNVSETAETGGSAFYSIGIDNRKNFYICQDYPLNQYEPTFLNRRIVRENEGTWEWNNSTNFIIQAEQENWVPATSMYDALEQAFWFEGFLRNLQFTETVFAESVNSVVTTPSALYFSNDGAKMYIGDENDTHQFTLSTPWDIRTRSLDGTNSVYATDMHFSPDGMRAFLSTFGSIRQFNLITPWDITGISDLAIDETFDTTAYETAVGGLTFNDVGTKMYISGTNSSGHIYEFDLSTPWDLSTVTYNNVEIDEGSQLGAIQALHMSNDGTVLYALEDRGGSFIPEILCYELTTPYDLSSSVGDTKSKNYRFPATNNNPRGMYFTPDDKGLFVVRKENQTLYQMKTNTFFPNRMSEFEFSELLNSRSVLGTGTLITYTDTFENVYLEEPQLIDLVVGMEAPNYEEIPKVEGLTINYDDGETVIPAELGVDYEWDTPTEKKIRITALQDNNLKIRID